MASGVQLFGVNITRPMRRLCIGACIRSWCVPGLRLVVVFRCGGSTSTYGVNMESVKRFLLHDLAAPLTRRAGTALAAYLVGVGATSDDATAIIAGLVALCSVGLDLVLSKAQRGLE